MADKRQLRDEVTRTVLEGDATASRADRAAAAANAGLAEPRKAFVAKVSRAAYQVTDDDIAELKAAGISDDEIFELAVCAAVGEATRQLDAAMAAVAIAAAGDAAPAGKPD